MLNRRTLRDAALLLGLARPAMADTPVASYVFPAGGRRGATVDFRVGGLNLNSKASFEMLGPGVEASETIRRVETVWFEGPIIPLPDSQQVEDYPKDHAGRVTLAPDAPTGPRAWRLWTAQGASGSLPFIVGDLPEVVELETVGDSVPVPVTLPVTINGRIFPREDVDLWSFPLREGEVLTAQVAAGRLGSPLDPWLEALDPDGRRVHAANFTSAPAILRPATDARLAFVAPRGGTYAVKIHDVNVKGGQNFVYRLTLTTGPSVARVFPLGGRRGAVVAFSAEGLGLTGREEPVSLPEAGAGRGPELAVVRVAGGSAAVEVDDLPGALESEPNDEPSRATPLPVPGVGDGRIGREGDVDVWALVLAKGRSYVLDVRAARLGSNLDALLSLTGPDGKEVARAEGVAARGGDPSLTFRATSSGTYVAKVVDRFRSRGGSAWAYRLRVAEAPSADYRLSLAADTLSVPRGGAAKLKVEAVRLGGFEGPIALEVEGLPEGVSVEKAVIGPKAGSVELPFKAAAGAPIRSARLTVRGSAEIGGSTVERVATRRGTVGLPEIDSVRLAVALPTPFQIGGPVDFGWTPRGSIRRRRYKIERNGFAGPIEVRLADRQARHLQGVTGPVVIVPPGVDELEYPVTLPPWMEIGRTSRTVVAATGVIRDPDGVEHEVSYSTPRIELQIATVVGPGRLGLESRRTSLSFVAGGVLEVPVKVSRGREVRGPIRVELAGPGPSQRLSGRAPGPRRGPGSGGRPDRLRRGRGGAPDRPRRPPGRRRGGRGPGDRRDDLDARRRSLNLTTKRSPPDATNRVVRRGHAEGCARGAWAPRAGWRCSIRPWPRRTTRRPRSPTRHRPSASPA